MTAYRLIWSKGAIRDWNANRKTRRFLSHTISNIDRLSVKDAFVGQLRSGTPWLLVHQDTGNEACSGIA